MAISADDPEQRPAGQGRDQRHRTRTATVRAITAGR
jgi:hypothetical protein